MLRGMDWWTFGGADASVASTWFGLRHARLKVVVLQPTVVSRFGCFVFEFWVLRLRVLGASFSRFGCFVLRSSFSSASFSKLPTFQGSYQWCRNQNQPTGMFRWYFSGCRRRSFLGRHLRQAPTHISGKTQNFLVVVVHTWTKHGVQGRRRSCITVPFSMPTLGVLGRMCCEEFEIWNVLWRFQK